MIWKLEVGTKKALQLNWATYPKLSHRATGEAWGLFPLGCDHRMLMKPTDTDTTFVPWTIPH